MKLSSYIEAYGVGLKYNQNNYSRAQGAYKLAERLRQWEEYERRILMLRPPRVLTYFLTLH
jgi:hypothetical protein